MVYPAGSERRALCTTPDKSEKAEATGKGADK
jgi:hypothetical protein